MEKILDRSDLRFNESPIKSTDTKQKKKKKHKGKPTSHVKCDQKEEQSGGTKDCDVFGPALPPHLIQKGKTTNIVISHRVDHENGAVIIGPNIPKEYQGTNNNLHVGDSDNEIYGPLPNSPNQNKRSSHIQLEERALQLRMSTINDDFPSTTTSTTSTREEWMLELPDVGLKTGLAALSNMKRGFHQGKNKPDFTDRSSWTKVPDASSRKKATSPNESGKHLLKESLSHFEKLRDKEQERVSKKYDKIKAKSLVDMHQKKLRKEQKEKKKKLLKNEISKVERVPFKRDVDLKLNKIDRHFTKQIIDKSKDLDKKFANGEIKYL